MDHTNVTKLRDTLIAVRDGEYPDRFDMSDYFLSTQGELHDFPKLYNADPNRCGTAACLLGWACLLANPSMRFAVMPQKQGREWLGLNEREGDWWAMGRWADWTPIDDDDYPEPVPLSLITVEMAIAFLDKVLATGDTMCEVWYDND